MKNKMFDGFRWKQNGGKKDNSLALKRHSLLVKMVDVWLQKEERYRSDAVHASFILLMSDFLFSTVNLPPKWLGWACKLKMVELSREPQKATKELSRSKELAEHQIVVVKMLFKAQSVAETMAKNRYNLIGLLEFMHLIESHDDLSKAVTHARSQEQIKQLSDPLNEISAKYSSMDEVDHKIEMSLQEFANSSERRVLAALLVGRSIKTMIFNVEAYDEDIVKDVAARCMETENAIRLKNNGNEHFKNKDYAKALKTYSKAIRLCSYSAFLYGNRCQTALKMKQFGLAISDGYRAITLKPRWGKAYYRLVKALTGKKKIDEAIEYNTLSLTLCSDAAEVSDLKAQQRSLFNARDCESGSSTEKALGNQDSVKVNPIPLKKSKKSKHKKKKSQKINVEELLEDDPPALLSEKESLPSFSDEELNGRRQTRKKLTKLPKSRTVNEVQKMLSQAVKNEAKTNTEAVIKHHEDPKQGEASSAKSRDNGKCVSNQVSLKSSRIKKENSDSRAPSSVTSTQNPPTPFLKLFREHEINGSKAVMLEDYMSATKEYEIAISYLERVPEDCKPNKEETFVFFYARAYASLEVSTPVQIARSLDGFSILLPTADGYSEIFHPILFFGIARAQFLLNNYALMARPIEFGMKMMEKEHFKSLSWPGVETLIPQSEPEVLENLFSELLRMSRCPQKPDATCFYWKCDRDEKNEERLHSLCEKEARRREIYKTDFNYEGLIKMCCSWECVTCFHYKCWPKFRRNVFGKSGDKEVLDLSCFTEGCQGLVSQIVMIDEQNKIKKDIKSEKSHAKEKEENRKAPAARMSKNERNLNRRRKQLEEAKDRKHSAKQDHENFEEEPTSAKQKSEEVNTSKAISDADVKDLTMLKRDEAQLSPEKKSKNKNKQKKKQTGMISLQDFLGNTGSELNMVDAEEAISSSSDAQLRVPENLREEMHSFDSHLPEKEVMRTFTLYKYFEDFFKANGPTKVQGELLLQQQLHLPEEMNRTIENSNGIIPFLCRNSDRFVVLAPYIGLPSQQEELIRLSTQYNTAIRQKNPPNETTRLTSGMDALDCDFDTPADLSDFARDLYGVGEVDMSDILTLTGGGGDVPKATKILDLTRKNAEKSTGIVDTEQKRVISHRGDGDHVRDTLCREMDLYLEENDQDDDVHSNSLELDSESPASSKDSKLSQQTEESVEVGSTLSDESFLDDLDAEIDDEDCSSTCDAEIQVDGLPSYEEEVANLESEKETLHSRLQDLTDRYTRLNAATRTEINKKNEELNETREQLVTVKKDALEVAQHAEAELKKISKDKSLWQENIKAMKLQVKEAQSREMEIEQQVKDKEADLQRFSRIYQEQRNSWLEEKIAGEKEREILNQALQVSNKRAVDAELKALECQENFGLKTLIKARNDCENIVAEFDNLMRIPMNNPSTQGEIYSGLLTWKNNLETCSKYIEDTKNQFALHADMIRRGKKLADLSSIAIPTPPAPGPNVQQFTIQASRVPNLGGTPLSLNSFPLNGVSSSSEPLLNNNLDTLPTNTAPRVPQPPIGTGKQSGTTQKGPAVASVSSSSSQPKGSFEKIMSQLQSQFPSVSRADLAQCIKEVRQRNNNSLTGLSFEDIVQQTSLVVGRKNLVR